MNQKVKVLINTSTYKENHEDKVTDVINNLIYSILKSDKNFEFLVLKPMSTEKHKEILLSAGPPLWGATRLRGHPVV